MVSERTYTLAESETKYRDLVDNALLGVFKALTNGEIIYVNEVFMRIFGSESEAAPDSFRDRNGDPIDRWIDPKNWDEIIRMTKEEGSVHNRERECGQLAQTAYQKEAGHQEHQEEPEGLPAGAS